jgi:hypothetical protein
MKKFYIFLFIAILGIAMESNAQAPIVVQNGSTVSQYTTLANAVTAANSGDTIYLPGGSWNIGTQSIAKSLHIIGVGHNPDSAQASGITTLTGDISLDANSSNGSFVGINLMGSFLTTTALIQNYKMRRCVIAGAVSFGTNFTTAILEENVFKSVVNGTGSTNNLYFYNNFFWYSFNGMQNSVFKNNIFFCSSSPGSSTITFSLFENNIFTDAFVTTYLATGKITSSQFFNNLFTEGPTFPYGTNSGSNNKTGQVLSNVFVSQSGTSYNYSHNYHLKNGCLGINAGTDGQDMGVYGGVFPWKDGSVPHNPHVIFKNFSGYTDPNGDLQINIKVKAQDH